MSRTGRTNRSETFMRRRMLGPTRWLLALAFAALGGCTPQSATEPASDAAPRRDVTVRLLVVDDSALAAAITQVAGEWKARSGASLTVSESTGAQLLAAKAMPTEVDAVIYPPAMLGELTTRQWLRPLPADYAASRELDWSDTFELLQIAETQWQQSALGIPLGSPVLVCYYRADLFEKFHRRPPSTWKEFHELAEFFSRRENLSDAAPAADATWHGCIQPLSEGWAGRLLLARAAAYVKHRDHFSTYFEIESMKPLVDGPGYVRALEELVADAKLGPDDPRANDLDAARTAFLGGQAALAIAWPSHQRSTKPPAASVAPSFSELPGETDVYNFANATWELRTEADGDRVTLLGLAGRQASISANTANSREAFQLLGWLSGKKWGGDIGSVSSASAATTLYRRSQLRAPAPWVDAGTDTEAARVYGETVRDALSRPSHLFVPRIPGHDRYLASLDAAAAEALAGQATAAEALAKAATAWETITDELGRDEQRRAYRQSLGLEP
jgi:multiple sugar transport system substrate-binding protein